MREFIRERLPENENLRCFMDLLDKSFKVNIGGDLEGFIARFISCNNGYKKGLFFEEAKKYTDKELVLNSAYDSKLFDILSFLPLTYLRACPQFDRRDIKMQAK